MTEARSPLPRRVFLILLGLGELVRILILALVGGSRFAGAAVGSIGAGAWLLVYLAPHAVIASAFLFMVEASAGSAALARLVVPAKLLGVLATAAAIAAELASDSAGSVDLVFSGLPLPQWLLLVSVAAWDLLVLGAVLISLLSVPSMPADPPPIAQAGPAPANPVYREVDVEVVNDREQGHP